MQAEAAARRTVDPEATTRLADAWRAGNPGGAVLADPEPPARGSIPEIGATRRGEAAGAGPAVTLL